MYQRKELTSREVILQEMATEVRQVKRVELADWFTDTYGKCSSAENQLSASIDVRHESRFLSNETTCQTKWDQYATDVRLADHITHMRQWKEKLERTMGQLDQEVASLSEAKETCEETIDFIYLRTDVAIECLTLREGRRNTEVVLDQPDEQLHKEIELIEKVKKNLHQRISDAFEQLCLLQEARQEIQANLQDKILALAIDIDQYNLTTVLPNVTSKTDPVRTPKGSTTILQWNDFSCSIKDRADAELKTSTSLREQIHHMLHQSANDFEAQKQATEFAFRKRIYETHRAKDEMEYLKKNTEETIADVKSEYRAMERALMTKYCCLKKAQTRLESRTYRSNVELCCDAVHYGLVDETKQLLASILALEEKLKQSQHTLDGLNNSLKRLTEDINLKAQTLHLDTQCLDIGLKLTPLVIKRQGAPANVRQFNKCAILT